MTLGHATIPEPLPRRINNRARDRHPAARTLRSDRRPPAIPPPQTHRPSREERQGTPHQHHRKAPCSRTAKAQTDGTEPPGHHPHLTITKHGQTRPPGIPTPDRGIAANSARPTRRNPRPARKHTLRPTQTHVRSRQWSVQRFHTPARKISAKATTENFHPPRPRRDERTEPITKRQAHTKQTPRQPPQEGVTKHLKVRRKYKGPPLASRSRTEPGTPYRRAPPAGTQPDGVQTWTFPSPRARPKRTNSHTTHRPVTGENMNRTPTQPRPCKAARQTWFTHRQQPRSKTPTRTSAPPRRCSGMSQHRQPASRHRPPQLHKPVSTGTNHPRFAPAIRRLAAHNGPATATGGKAAEKRGSRSH